MNTYFRITLIFSMLFFIGIVSLQAQKTVSPESGIKDWHYTIEPYLMFPNMSGTTGIGELLPPVEVDANVGDILGHLKMGAMLYLEASNDDWTISSDLLYMKLGQDITTNRLVTGGDVTMQELAWEVAGLKRLLPGLDAGVALRLISLDMEINTQTLLANRSASTSRTWVDPVIVARTQGLINDKWLYSLRGDLGGFGIGSDFTWQVQADFGYRFSNLFSTTLGYRVIGIDYNKGNGSDHFLYDVDTYGAVVRFRFSL